MLARRVVILLVLLLVAAGQAQAEDSGPCEQSCRADPCDAPCGADGSEGRGSNNTRRAADDESAPEGASAGPAAGDASNDTQPSESTTSDPEPSRDADWSAYDDAGSLSLLTTKICRVVDVLDPTAPVIDPDGCVQRLINKLLRPST